MTSELCCSPCSCSYALECPLPAYGAAVVRPVPDFELKFAPAECSQAFAGRISQQPQTGMSSSEQARCCSATPSALSLSPCQIAGMNFRGPVRRGDIVEVKTGPVELRTEFCFGE